jgi:hypothetical protein
MEILREYATATTIYFPMIVAGEMNFAGSGDWTPVAADTQFSEDGAGFANTGSPPANEGGGIWSLDLLSTELTGAVIVIKIEDAVTKAVEDQAIIIQTWGDDSAGLPLNAVADFVLRRALASADSSGRGDSVIFRSLLGAARKLCNRIYRSGSDLIITEEDDSTAAGTQAMTTSAAAEQITDLDTT